MRILNLIVERISKILLLVAGVMLILMMLHVVADVIGKYFFRRPVVGTIEIVSWYYMVGVAMLPVAYVQINRGHLMVELFTMKLPPRGIAALDALVGIVASAYTGMVAWLVWFEAIRATARNRSLNLIWFDMPTWPSNWMLPVSFGLLTIVFVLQTVDDLGRVVTKR